MRQITLLILLLLTAGYASAQSLKSEEPAPLQKGINKGTADSLVGTHYWYYYTGPGSARLTVRFKPMGMYGNAQRTTLSITLYDEKRTWHMTKTITSDRDMAETTFSADKVANRVKTIISVAPPPGGYLRAGGDYEIEATGDVSFDEAKVTGDPIVRTYSAMVNNYGATRFLADGTLQTSSGMTGTWKLFDPENRIYTVSIKPFQWSVQYRSGYGLVKDNDPTIIVFQEERK